MHRSYLLITLLLSACATYTGDYRERLVQSLPDKNGVTFANTGIFPGRVLCGEYTANRWDGYGRETHSFVVTPQHTLNRPGDDEIAVYCSNDPEAALFDTYGIGGEDADRASLEKISADMAAIDRAVLTYYNTRGYAPRAASHLLDGEFGVVQANLNDPWGRPYRFSAGLAGRSLPRFALATLGRDGTKGGTGPDADIDNDNIAVVRHVLALSRS